MKTRSDKKFGVKIFLPHQNKLIFQNSCTKHHLSMMFVSSEYIKLAMDTYPDKEINNIIFSYYPKQRGSSKNLGFITARLTNEYWQKIAVHAINNGISISKATSCIFNHGLSTIQMHKIMEEHGLTFNNIVKKSKYR